MTHANPKINQIELWERWGLAISNGNWGGFKQGLQDGIDPEKPPSDSRFYGWSGLAEAIFRGQDEMALALIEQGQQITTWTHYSDGQRLSYLHMAAKFNRATLVQPLIDKGIEVDRLSWQDWPAWFLIGSGLDYPKLEESIATFNAFQATGFDLGSIRPHGWHLVDYFLNTKEDFAFAEHVLQTSYQPSMNIMLRRIKKESQNLLDNSGLIHPSLIHKSEKIVSIVDEIFIGHSKEKLDKAIPKNQPLSKSTSRL